MKKIPFLLAILCIMSCSKPSDKGPDTNDQVEALLQKMTLKEKIGQMNQYSVGPHITGPSGPQDGRYARFTNGEVGSVLNMVGVEETRKLQKLVVEESRLGIPLIFSYDVIHGYKTIFPIPLGESASWDLEAIRKSARVAAKETAASGIQWTFAPMVDISRDARWGRVMEGAGEDPYLVSVIGRERIKGYQGDDLSDPLTIAACAKHFAGYGFGESGKDYNTVVLGRNDLWNYVFPPFLEANEAGVATFMNAFNDIDGVPSTSSEYLVRDLLKGEWDFNGVLVSDWNSIGELVNHSVAGDKKDAAELAIRAGTDVDMEGDAFIENLEELVKEGKVSEELIDDGVRRILQLKFDLGLFDDPYKYMDAERENEIIEHPDHIEAARDVARKSIVLLKNEGNMLPLRNKKSIAIIGPLAKDKDTPIGNWRAQGEANSAVSFYEGMVQKLGNNVRINYAEGCKLSIGPNSFPHELVIDNKDRSGFSAAVEAARKSEVVFMVLGEPAYMSGEARSRSEIGLPGLQLELLKEVFKVNKNIVLVLMNGRPLAIPWEAENIPSILETWHLGSQAGNAIADVIAGDYNPSGKLPMCFPRSVGQVPVYYNYRNTGRPASDMIFYHHHMDIERTPLYPFGYGLSYTSFEFSVPEVSQNGQNMEVSVQVTNTGNVSGKEVVQVYIRDLISSVARPVKELKSFELIELDAGESRTVNLTLDRKSLSFFKQNGDSVFEPGEFEVFVGNNSEDVQSVKVEVN